MSPAPADANLKTTPLVPQSSMFDVPADVAIAANAQATILLDQQYVDGRHAIDKFRISVIQEGVK